jgi:drug/metabolite transporter (DMT)-like permease
MNDSPTRLKIWLAFAAVYLIWGSTYLGIRFAIETIPPLIMAGIRFVAAGAILYVWTRMRGAQRPTLAHWRSATVIGLLLLLIGNGAVSWAEQVVPSGITALLVAGSPLWFVGLEWMQRGIRPTAGVIVGLMLGSLGIVVLVDPAKLVGGQEVDILGASVLVIASFSWSAGSLYSRRAHLPSSPLMATGMEMLSGGIALLAFGLLAGELNGFNVEEVSTRSLLALAYLTVFGSLIAFSSYIWLLKVATPALASTYAYVNPVIAVFVGWLFADEPLTARVLLSAAIIVGAVAIITSTGVLRSSKMIKSLFLGRRRWGHVDSNDEEAQNVQEESSE